MRSWLLLLSGLILWAAHFFLIYGIGEFAGVGAGPRIAIGVVTLLCLGLGLALIPRLRRREAADGFDRWRNRSGIYGLGLGLIAIVYQTLPVLFPA